MITVLDIQHMAKDYEDASDDELYGYLEMEGATNEQVEAAIGKDHARAYDNWIYYNLK